MPPSHPKDPELRPVINNAYSPTLWHWPLGSDTRAYGPANASRRLSQIMSAVVGSGKSHQTQPRASGNDMSVQWEQLPLVNTIRERCRKWQDAGFPGTTPVTKELLQHWLQPEHTDETRLYFAQQDAILSAIYLNEGSQDDGHAEALAKLTNEMGQSRQYSPRQQYTYSHRERMEGLQRTCHKMATGTGKTAVIAALILYHAANHYENPADCRFAGNFLILSPNVTVKTRLRGAVIPDTDEIHDEYGERDLIPSPRERYRDALNRASIVVANWQAFKPKEPGRSPAGQRQN